MYISIQANQAYQLPGLRKQVEKSLSYY